MNWLRDNAELNPRTSARPLLVVAAVAVLLIGIVGGFTLLEGSPMDWRGLERAAESTSISDQAEAVDESLRMQFLAANHSLLPPGATLVIDERTFAEIDADIATVSATATGPESAVWELILVRQDDGSWLIYSTSRR